MTIQQTEHVGSCHSTAGNLKLLPDLRFVWPRRHIIDGTSIH